MNAGSGRHAAARAADLAALFVRQPADFGAMTPVAAEAVPEPFRTLLDHHSHMTVAMERHHGGPVALRIVAEAPASGDGRYAREIVLLRPADRVVQFGIVRIDLGSVDAGTAARIRAGGEPLGRILVETGALCAVGDVSLVEVVPGPHLERLIGPQRTFGRVATITVDGGAAVELLEIVAGG